MTSHNRRVERGICFFSNCNGVVRQPWSLLSLKNMVAPWMHPMEKSNEHQENRITGPGYELMVVLQFSAEGFEQPSWTFSHDEGALSPSQNENMEGFFEGSCGFPHKSWMPFLSVASLTRLFGFGNSSGCSHNAFKRLCVLVKWQGCYDTTPL